MEELLFGCDSTTDPLVDELLGDLLDKRIIVFSDDVDKNILKTVSLQIIRFNVEDKDIPEEKRRPIWIIIRSPGGNVTDGFNLTDIIKASKTPVYTVATSLCASMGFHIYVAGHKRYAFKNSILLLHEGELGVANSVSKAKDCMKFCNSLEERTKNHVIECTKITPEFYDSIFEREYYMYANEEAKELGCVDYIIGEDVSLEDVF